MQTAESVTHINFWAQVAEYHQSPASKTTIMMYARDSHNIPVSELWVAWDKYRLNPHNSRMPMPGQLKAILNPTLTPDDEANEVAARILTSIPKHGWSNSLKAREYIGEFGWKVVEMQGGWHYLCETHKASQDGIFQAQCRNFAKTVSIKAKLGTLDTPPALPDKTTIRIEPGKAEKQRLLARQILEGNDLNQSIKPKQP